MAELNIKECGDQKAENRKERIKALGEVAAGMGLFAGGVILYKAGFKVGSSAGDGYAGGATSMIGGAAMATGTGLVGHGAVRYLAVSPKMQKRFINACQNAEKAVVKISNFTKKKIAPFLKKAIENVKLMTKKGIDINDENGKYASTLVDGEVYVKQPKIVRDIRKLATAKDGRG